MSAGRVKKVIICDIDGTLIRGETQFFLLVFMFQRRLVPFFLFIRIAGWFALYRLGLLQGSERIRAMAYQAFTGWSRHEFEKLCRDFFDEKLRSRIRREVLMDLHRLRFEGYELIMASATLKPLAERCREYVGFGIALATELEIVDERLTGRILGRSVYGEHKLKIVEEFVARNGLTWADSWAFSDHVSDLAILLKAGTPVAVSPESRLAKEAIKRQWVIYQ